jgi:GntR family transcriptional repressor for pyruvate dehydrogenase complex
VAKSNPATERLESGEARRREGTAAPVKARVVARIHGLIGRRSLRPGDRLPTERELAEEFAVSRPTIRSALQSLAAMGVVRSRKGAGTFIQGGRPTLGGEPLRLLADLHDFTSEEMFEARGALEVAGAGLAAIRSTPSQREQMATELTGMFSSIEDTESFLRHDIGFHQAVALGSNNAVITALVEMVSSLVFERRRKTIEEASDLRESAAMHRRIFDAIRARDASEARSAMALHLRLSLETWPDDADPLLASEAKPKAKAKVQRRVVLPR